MNGVEPLLRMRRARNPVRAIWIVDGEDVRSRDWHTEANCDDGQMHARLQINESDIPEALDLRCVIGMPVRVSGERGEARSRRLHAALIEAGAAQVITSFSTPAGMELVTHGV